jgi:hypothetical protein
VTDLTLQCCVSHAEVKQQSPYNYGEVICASVYCGPDVNFGNGASHVLRARFECGRRFLMQPCVNRSQPVDRQHG